MKRTGTAKPQVAHSFRWLPTRLDVRPPRGQRGEFPRVAGFAGRTGRLGALCGPMATHYEVLGVPRDARKADIKRAYMRKGARCNHRL